MADGYNGWTNYETWNMALWVDNEEGIYNPGPYATLESEDGTPVMDMYADLESEFGGAERE